MKHWTKFLPEAGTITHFGNDQEHRSAIILTLVKELENHRIQYLNEETRLVNLAKQDWTIDEINIAMKMANKKGAG